MVGRTATFDRHKLKKIIWKRRRPSYVIIPIVILVIFLFIGAFGSFLAPHSPTAVDLPHRYQPPVWDADGNWTYPLGTDSLGRDILSRMMYGARVSLEFALAAVLLTGIIGGLLGLISGYYGGWVDTVIMRFVDLVISIPLILVAMTVVIVTGPSLINLILVVSLRSWPMYSRVARAEALSLKERDFVASAQVVGVSRPRIIARHIFPNVLNSLVVLATLQIGTIIMIEAMLSFLGVGIPPPNPAWGQMVNQGRDVLDTAWWVSAFPGMAIGAVVLSFNVFGDWLRDRLDPRLRQV